MPELNFPFVIGNWKMNLTPYESETIAKKVVAGLPPEGLPVEIGICPSYPAMERVQRVIAKTSISLGSQNMFWKEDGSYTGEVSVRMLKDMGCHYVILGHSERRIHLCETDVEINKKVKLALQYGLVPIICVGEKYEERQDGKRDIVIMNEIANALKGIDCFNQLIIAYEPVWVIGRGEAIDPNEAHSAIGLIKYTLKDIYPQKTIDEKIRILYGGSVDDKNITDFVDNENIHGVLVGGSSLKPEVFIGMIYNLAKKFINSKLNS
ncbi:MAG: triose-phosphate isomerase [Patescibacteria group bacterium]|jgi:triosephosphate isomerase